MLDKISAADFKKLEGKAVDIVDCCGLMHRLTVEKVVEVPQAAAPDAADRRTPFSLVLRGAADVTVSEGPVTIKEGDATVLEGVHLTLHYEMEGEEGAAVPVPVYQADFS